MSINRMQKIPESFVQRSAKDTMPPRMSSTAVFAAGWLLSKWQPLWRDCRNGI